MNAQKKVPGHWHFLAGIAAVVALALGYWLSGILFVERTELTGLHATRFSEPRALRPFRLSDHTGAAFGPEQLADKWSLVFFGYTHCPDVCPTTMSTLNSVAGRLGDRAGPVQFVFVSVDPERDTPERLQQYVTWFNGDFIGVTGPPEDLEALTRQLGVVYMRIPNAEEPDNYTVDHTASVLLFDPDARFHAIFSSPLEAAKIADDLVRIAGAYRPS
jgi:protein SCO1/2